MSRSEVVIYKGIKFRRYPDSKRWPDRSYFTPGIGDKQKGVRRLHEEIWQDHNQRKIPPGYHVHHLDHDPLNNDPANLGCIPHSTHSKHHSNSPEQQAFRESPEWQDHLASIRPLAAQWHSSPEGREWHRQHGIRVAANMKDKAGVCEQCGNAFLSKRPERFCSNACKSAWRRDSGLDDVTRVCQTCGNEFTVNRYKLTANCSRSCAGKARRARQLTH